MRTSNELRQLFLEFMESRGHKILPGISLVPTDPSIFLTTAGVVPFQAMLEGREPAPYPRIATCQRCCRTTDLESVGKFARYHTFFEMLGNWSFGDYFKRESLTWGWEFVTQVLEMDPNRIWGTIYPSDDEAYEIWTRDLGVPAERILRLEDNMWGPVLETGACGPDSEMYYDLGPEFGCGQPTCAPGCDCDRYLEFWNHVFTQWYKTADGKFEPLQNKNIDTGMGLERLTCVVQNRRSVYETDLFAPIMDRVDEIIERAVGSAGDREDWRKRVIADHTRAATFMVMDGIYPSNAGRGYVLRRIIRRAVTFGYLLGVRGTFLHAIVPLVVEKMAPGYPELLEKQGVILDKIRQEETQFESTLDRGLPRFLEQARAGQVIDGAFAFDVRSTYGVPLQVMEELAVEQGASIDLEGYRQAEAGHRQLSGHGAAVKSNYRALEVAPTEFLGYSEETATGKVLALLHDGEEVDTLTEGETGVVVLNRTPFYAESGGQVGDTGSLFSVDAGLEATVDDAQKLGPVFAHQVRVGRGRIYLGMDLSARIDGERREKIRHAHTATHLLHAALRQVLGAHVVQRGSVVEPDRLRFDFAHDAAVTAEQLSQVEDLMNAQVLLDSPVSISEVSQEEARRAGAMMLFGEKYGEVVRMVQISGYSTELCGGTHAATTGAIGQIRVLSEGSVSAGVRRIECATGLAALHHAQAQGRRIREIADALGGSTDQILDRIQAQKEQLSTLRRQLQEARKSAAGGALESLLAERQTVEGVALIAGQVENGDAESVKTMVDQVAERLRDGVVLLAGGANGKGVLVAKVVGNAAGRGAHAGNLVREAAKLAGGGGGGRPDFAQAGARDLSRLPEALAAVPGILAAQVGAELT